MTARAIKPSTAETGLLSATLAMLPQHTGDLSSAAEALLEPHLLDLITLSSGGRWGRTGRAPRRLARWSAWNCGR